MAYHGHLLSNEKRFTCSSLISSFQQNTYDMALVFWWMDDRIGARNNKKQGSRLFKLFVNVLKLNRLCKQSISCKNGTTCFSILMFAWDTSYLVFNISWWYQDKEPLCPPSVFPFVLTFVIFSNIKINFVAFPCTSDQKII